MPCELALCWWWTAGVPVFEGAWSPICRLGAGVDISDGLLRTEPIASVATEVGGDEQSTVSPRLSSLTKLVSSESPGVCMRDGCTVVTMDALALALALRTGVMGRHSGGCRGERS